MKARANARGIPDGLILFLLVATFLGTAIVTSAATLWIAHRPSLEVLAQWRQPEPQGGQDASTSTRYYLSVVATDLNFRGFPLFVSRNYCIKVARLPDPRGYGHAVAFDFFTTGEDMRRYLRKARVEWVPRGVWFFSPSGHRLFIPREMYAGGR